MCENVEDLVKLVAKLEDDQISQLRQTIQLDYKSTAANFDENNFAAENRQVRARGLPWQASDQHVAQFFAGLDISPGGIALCLSSEGRRNGEVVVNFENEMSRDLALKRHRNFLLSRYIEVYKATLDEFLQVASGSSTEAMEFVSTNAVNVRMRGLPYDCTEQQIKTFFEPLKVLDKILFISRSDGRPTGDAFVQFETEEDAQNALLKHRQTIGQRYIELFKSTAAEVQQVVKRCNQINNQQQMSPNQEIANQVAAAANLSPQNSQHSQDQQEKRKDCIRLRGLPYEAQVQHIVTFLGEFAKMVKFQGVHMIFNNQGHPSGEAFIQMANDAAAAATSLATHNKFMVIGKKQRYIEVFQCSAEDLNLQHLVKPVQQVAPTFAPQLSTQAPHHPHQQYWTGYPSPPISPIIPGQLTQLVVYGITINVGIPELVAQFSSPEVQVENVLFTRWPTPVCPGEAVITIRSRQAQIPAPAPQFYAPPTFPHPHSQQFPHQAPIILEQ
ncbi:unnamed protein product [Caenorhabditis angaria]|uniref:RRM domain-containing protein n=1 Tax=Caenorhabditis angaria TaxID=860376 RepID=A0A9P1IDQ0_9PELO|nr:unnamed protein product [Caenorhabditis angaria]